MWNSRFYRKNCHSIDSKSNVLPERWFDPTSAIFRDFHEFFSEFFTTFVRLGQVVISIWNSYWKYIKNALKFRKNVVLFCPWKGCPVYFSPKNTSWFVYKFEFSDFSLVRLSGLKQCSQLPQTGRCSLSFQSAGGLSGALEGRPVELLYFSVVLFHRRCTLLVLVDFCHV